ncbi:MAG TPA: hypothetical protein VFQ17_09035 [Nocardioides sp.]|nr:hypothetical protein [Nocardioides sp.]
MLRRASCTLAALAAALVLAACSGDGSSGSVSPSGDAATDGNSAASGGDATPGSKPSPYLPVPTGVVLTDPGSELGFGEQATVAWRPTKGEEVGVLDVKVRKVVHADIKALQNWQLDAAGRTSSLYYVMMTVANVGDEDLSGQRIPLYVLDGANALVESSAFKKEFKPCPSPALPDGFVTGEKVTVCQAYLVPKRGEVDAVTFRPTEKFNPINWVGKVTEPKEPAKSRSAG